MKTPASVPLAQEAKNVLGLAALNPHGWLCSNGAQMFRKTMKSQKIWVQVGSSGKDREMLPGLVVSRLLREDGPAFTQLGRRGGGGGGLCRANWGAREAHRTIDQEIGAEGAIRHRGVRNGILLDKGLNTKNSIRLLCGKGAARAPTMGSDAEKRRPTARER